MNIQRLLVSVAGVVFAALILSVSVVNMAEREVWAQAGLMDNDEKMEASDSGRVTLSQRAASYYLVYPGLLPDHPLYLIKAIRDKLGLLFTFDASKKTDVMLQQADKRIGAAKYLTEGGKLDLAVKSAAKAVHTMQLVADRSLDEVQQKRIVDASYAYEEILQQLHERVTDAVKPVVDTMLEDIQMVRTKFEAEP